ncbi:hypothetical protein BU24DRAFT_25275 [Aaosphaeria arxii CBS 175.79]|uniref:Leucine rich repeat domain-containing protein n=1 Tax=Aaosphaeria arxii CBS 175.79 TaxID=1450172 RepID=A0A6A5YAR1_9PLEO|nr:uncharacterized protein BU24DRAFT_25275 [Aaosphaeria arxii CBS 175.79]KAF2021674.1 hypothetical protein BU24DRAFT_25275 [Aaosphaeria arxii CBS 175.79]
MDTEDGQIFIKNLAYFVRTHEKALANALQLQRQAPKRQSTDLTPSSPTATSNATTTASSSSSVWAAALSLPSLTFTSQTIKPAKLTLTPHHLFYLLSRFEELSIPVGPMNVRLENIHTDASPTNYVSFLSKAQRNKTRSSDRDSIHSVSSIRSVMSGMSSLWSSLRLSNNSAAKAEKQKAAIQEDLKYLFSAFTKIPCLRLAPDHKARLIAGYEEFPFDTAVPLFAFKNVTALEIYDVDFRQFHGWDRLAENLRSLTVKRAGVDDPADILINIVLDDIDKRRRRSAKAPPSPSVPCATPSPVPKHAHLAQSESPPSPGATAPRHASSPRVHTTMTAEGELSTSAQRQRSASPHRPASSRHGSASVYGRTSTPNVRRASGSSSSSVRSTTPRGSSSNLLSLGWFPSTKWRFLRHLSLADNALTSIPASSLAPVANTLQSLDLSANLFTEIPDSLATMSCLRALNLSNCMIESLHSLGRSPLPAITTLNLRSNRLSSLAGIERLLSLERVDLRDNKLTDPTEVARLTGVPEITHIYVHRNPFCKSYGNYRVMIFNLFRKTPGYTEDIVIDSTGPSSSERKQLVDRVPEPPSVPVVKPPPEDDVPPQPIPVKIVAAMDGTRSLPDSPRRTNSHSHRSKSGHTGSQRRKKVTKRRVVELSQTNTTPGPANDQAPPTNLFEQLPSTVDVPKTSDPADDLTGERSPPRFKEPSFEAALGDPTKKTTAQDHGLTQSVHIVHQQLPSLNTTLSAESVQQSTTSPPEFDASSDLYRKKIEALRQDFGNTWLSALSDESWETAPVTSFPEPGFTTTIRPAMPRTPSQGIVSGGRTLG